jgi:flagellar FliL protein
MSENNSETLSPESLKAKKLKIIKAVLLLFVILIGLVLFTPAKKLFTKTEEDPRMKDSTFASAVYFSEGLRDDPMCFQFARMLISMTNPSSGSVFYRETVYEKLTDRIPEACIAPSGSPPPAAVLQYIAATRPVAMDQSAPAEERGAQRQAVAEQKVAAAKTVVAIDPMVVNLQSDNGQWFLQASISLNMADAAGADLATARSAEIRNRILLTLSDKRPTELATAENKQRLADDLLAKLNQPLSGGVTLNVASLFFTSFVIQQQ